MSEKAEESKSEEGKFSVPVYVLSDETYNAMTESLKKREELFVPPEGQKFVGMKSYCSKHGDITGATQVINYVKIFKHGEEMVQFPDQQFVCKACYAEWVEKMRKDGAFGEVHAFPIFADLTEEDKKKIEEAKKDQQKE